MLRQVGERVGGVRDTHGLDKMLLEIFVDRCLDLLNLARSLFDFPARRLAQ